MHGRPVREKENTTQKTKIAFRNRLLIKSDFDCGLAFVFEPLHLPAPRIVEI
jgi:hypothetical protein